MRLNTESILPLVALACQMSAAVATKTEIFPLHDEKGRTEVGRLLMESMDKRTKNDPHAPSQSPTTLSPGASKGMMSMSTSSKGTRMSSSAPGSSKGMASTVPDSSKGKSSNAPGSSKGMMSTHPPLSDFSTEKKKVKQSQEGSKTMEMIAESKGKGAGKGKGKGKGSKTSGSPALAKSSKSPSVTKSSKSPIILMKKSNSGGKGKGMSMDLTAPPVTASPTISQKPTVSRKPSVSPSSSPFTASPTDQPSTRPSASPSHKPSKMPTSLPTTASPTDKPFTASPTDQPFTATPTESPTATFRPSQKPSSSPTETQGPSAQPTPLASSSPTVSQKPTVSQAPTGQTPLPTIAPDLSWNFFQGFDCDSDQNFWESLNSAGAADTGFPQLIEIDPGDPDTRCFLRMTPDTVFGSALATSAFLGIPVNDPPNFAFRMSIGYRIFGTLNNPEIDGDGADGMVFVMHRDADEAEAIGGTGGNLGVYSFNPAVAIKPALTVEWDTCKWICLVVTQKSMFCCVCLTNYCLAFVQSAILNSSTRHLITCISCKLMKEELSQKSHRRKLLFEHPKRIHLSSEACSLTSKFYSTLNQDQFNTMAQYLNLLAFSNCDGNGNLEVRINNEGVTKPTDPLVTEQVSIQDIFFPDGGNGFVYVGYTAAIGGFADNHDVFGWEFVTGC